MDTSQIYKIRGTKVTSPYPVQLTPAETRLIFRLQKLFSPQHIFADIYFPSLHRGTDLVQIDCLAINQQGIFIFESKDYSGWIYGNGRQRYWTQTLNLGREKHQFYNPILQNSTHIRALQDLIPTQVSVYSIIVFGNNSTLKTISAIPENCRICTSPQIITTISQIKSPRLLQDSEITSLSQSIARARVIPTTFIRNDHIQEIRDFTKNK